MGKSELIALLNLSSWCLVMVQRLFLTVPQGSLQFVIVVFPDHTHYFRQNPLSRSNFVTYLACPMLSMQSLIRGMGKVSVLVTEITLR